jgi:hypothetical protein
MSTCLSAACVWKDIVLPIVDQTVHLIRKASVVRIDVEDRLCYRGTARQKLSTSRGCNYVAEDLHAYCINRPPAFPPDVVLGGVHD